MRIGTIIKAEPVPRTSKLYKVQVDLGEIGVKQTISGLVGYYTPEELVNRRIVFLANLEPTKFSGETSEGMLLAAEKDGKIALLTIDHEIKNGAKVT
jgi:methionyl-tRNA synthetase